MFLANYRHANSRLVRGIHTILGDKAVAIFVATAFLSAPLAAQPTAYISNQLDDSVSVIDTATGSVVETIAVPGKPAGIAVAPDGNKVYVSTPEAKGFAVVDTKKHEVIAKVTVNDGTLGITVAPDGKRIYVADWYKNTVSAIDADSLQIIKTIGVGESPSGLV
ncbi:MAG: YncE family protein, partial [Methylococcaceae bacterium]